MLCNAVQLDVAASPLCCRYRRHSNAYTYQIIVNVENEIAIRPLTYKNSIQIKIKQNEMLHALTELFPSFFPRSFASIHRKRNRKSAHIHKRNLNICLQHIHSTKLVRRIDGFGK